MGQCQKHHIAGLRPVTSPSQRRPEVPFDHTEDRLHLPTLPVCLLVEPFGHQSSVSASGRLGSRPTVLGRNDGLNPAGLTRKHMIGFGVIPRIGGEFINGHPSQSRFKRSSELIHVGAWLGRPAPVRSQLR